MNYEIIKEKLLEIQEMMREIPLNCKGNSEMAAIHRSKYMNVKRRVSELIEVL